MKVRSLVALFLSGSFIELSNICLASAKYQVFFKILNVIVDFVICFV